MHALFIDVRIDIIHTCPYVLCEDVSLYFIAQSAFSKYRSPKQSKRHCSQGPPKNHHKSPIFNKRAPYRQKSPMYDKRAIIKPSSEGLRNRHYSHHIQNLSKWLRWLERKIKRALSITKEPHADKIVPCIQTNHHSHRSQTYPSDSDELREYRKSPTLHRKSPMYDKRAIIVKIYPSDQDDLREYPKSPTLIKRALCMTKEPYIWQKSPI